MKFNKYLILGLFLALLAFSCKKDDGVEPVEPPVLRDEGEVLIENEEAITQFLETHFFEMVDNPLNSNYQNISFDTIAGSDSDKEPIMDSEFLESKTVVQNDLDYTLYYLKIREGSASKPKPTFADLVLTTYRGQTLDLTIFDESSAPFKFDLPGENGIGGIITGLIETLVEFRGASDYVENPDNTIEFSDDYGIGATFIPSGLAYFAQSPSTIIPQYSPLIFTFQLYKTIQGDPDGDGIPSFYEDLNEDTFLIEDSDSDGIPDFRDADDDGDGTPTSEEIVVNDLNEDGYITEDELTLTDSDNDGTPDYLDPEVN